MDRAAAARALGDALAAMTIEVQIRRKAFRRAAGETEVLGALSLNIESGEIIALVGPSGCGKTTLLRIIGGLDRDFEGEVIWPAETPPRIGTVFQEPRLLPWRTVRENIALVQPPGSSEASHDLLATLGLAQFGDAYPPALSLGMARRVAIARAFSIAPELVLLDEPFVSLDAAMAERSREVLLQAWRARPTTAILVTHDLAEAASLADRLVLLSPRPTRVLEERPVPRELRRRGIATGALVAQQMIETDAAMLPAASAAGDDGAYFSVTR
jgi:NitT/TauT family transport system ATP-binding protein